MSNHGVRRGRGVNQKVSMFKKSCFFKITPPCGDGQGNREHTAFLLPLREKRTLYSGSHSNLLRVLRSSKDFIVKRKHR
jgi:hypothetical protein